jgi:hypothetical protein
MKTTLAALMHRFRHTGAVAPAEQGFSVALSADGNTAIVGGFGDNSGRRRDTSYTLPASMRSKA